MRNDVDRTKGGDAFSNLMLGSFAFTIGLSAVKLVGNLPLSWVIVLLPIWIWFAIILALLMLALFVALLRAIFSGVANG
jgi:hypothetical protein